MVHEKKKTLKTYTFTILFGNIADISYLSGTDFFINVGLQLPISVFCYVDKKPKFKQPAIPIKSAYLGKLLLSNKPSLVTKTLILMLRGIV